MIIGMAVASTSPFLFNFLRFSLAFVVMSFGYFAACWYLGHKVAAYTRCWRQGLLLGSILFMAFLTQAFGLQTTSATNAGFLTGLGLVFVPIIGRILFNQTVRLAQMLVIAISVLGLYFLTGAAENGFAAIVVGDYLIIISAILFAVHIVVTGRFMEAGHAVEMTIWQIFAMMVLSFLCSISLDKQDALEAVGKISAITIYIIVFTAVLSTCFGYLVQTYIQKFVPPIQVALILALEPVFAGAFDTIITGTWLSPVRMLGGGLILLSVIISEVKNYKEAQLSF